MMFGEKDGPPCDKYFEIPGHSFNVHTKFTFIEELYKSLSKLNYAQDTTGSIWYPY